MALTKSWLAVVGLFATVSLSVTACSAEVVDPTAQGASDDDDDGSGSTESGISVAGRWMLPADVRAAGAGARVTYDGGPDWNARLCAGGLRSGAQRLRTQLDAEFPAITSIQGYACRANTASPSKMSIHGTGRALDIFIPLSGGAADNTKGDAVANYLVKNANRLQIQYIIWDRTQWSANGSNDRAYTGPNPHIDHLHVEITEEAAAGGAVGAGAGGGGGAAACSSATLGRDVASATCVQARSDRLWYRCDNGTWRETTTSDSACSARHAL